MCCGLLSQGVQKVLSMDMRAYEGEKPHLVVVKFILRRGQTNVHIEIREFEGGIRVTGLLCLLGVGIGLGTFLVYKLCSHLHLRYFASSTLLDKTTLQLSSVSPVVLDTPDSGISLGIKKNNKPGILLRSQILKPSNVPQQWKKRIIDWLARSTFPVDAEEKAYCSDDDEGDDDDDDRILDKCKKKKKLDTLLTSTQSGWSSGFVSNPDNADFINCNNNSGCYFPGKQSLPDASNREWQNCTNEDELMDGIDEESEMGEGLGVQTSPTSETTPHVRPHSSLPRKHGGNKQRRPNSGRSSSSISSDILAGRTHGMRRNCYSFASHKSGDSSLYDYRESLVSKGFSVDLGENLDGVMLPDGHDFASCEQVSTGAQEHGTVNHMDWLQYELMKIQLDIDCLNHKFDDLCQPKDDKLSEHQILEDFASKKNRNGNTRRSASVESSERSPHQGSPHQGSPQDFETFDFIWDYHSDLAVEKPTFVSARPCAGDVVSSFDGGFDGGPFLNGEQLTVEGERNKDDDDDDDDEAGYNVIFENSDEENEYDRDAASTSKGRRESIVLFYFDDEINENFIDHSELINGSTPHPSIGSTPHPSIGSTPHPTIRSTPHSSIGSTPHPTIRSRPSFNSSVSSTPKHSSRLTSNKAEGSEHQESTYKKLLKAPTENDSISRLFQPVSPRHLRKSKLGDEQETEENCSIGDNSVNRIDRIFSREERRIVGEERKLFEHLETDLHVDVMQISNIRKGYSKIFETWGSSNVRSFRSDRYSILGPITFQVLLRGFPILSDVGGNFQNSVQYLVAAIDNGHAYLMEWKYKGSMWTLKNEVLFKLINSLRIFCEQVSAVSGMSKRKCREQYLASLLNHSSDMEVHLMEALKIVIMLRIISNYKINNNNNIVDEIYGPSYSTPELIFRNLINPIEDGTVLDDIQLSLLSSTLRTQIEIFQPKKCGTVEFLKTYPTKLDGCPSSWQKISIIEDESAFMYCLPAFASDE